MIAVKVTYRVKPEFVAKNWENIRQFMADFKQIQHIGFSYNVYLLEDSVTFLHLSHFKNDEVQKQVLDVASFKLFQRQRDESGLNHTHKIDIMQTVAVSAPVFN